MWRNETKIAIAQKKNSTVVDNYEMREFLLADVYGITRWGFLGSVPENKISLTEGYQESLSGRVYITHNTT